MQLSKFGVYPHSRFLTFTHLIVEEIRFGLEPLHCHHPVVIFVFLWLIIFVDDSGTDSGPIVEGVITLCVLFFCELRTFLNLVSRVLPLKFHAQVIHFYFCVASDDD